MNFKELCVKYEETFGTYPPILTTLDVENEEYLKMLKDAIDSKEPLTRNELDAIFMPDDELLY